MWLVPPPAYATALSASEQLLNRDRAAAVVTLAARPIPANVRTGLFDLLSAITGFGGVFKALRDADGAPRLTTGHR